jgi:hypothetical protein
VANVTPRTHVSKLRASGGSSELRVVDRHSGHDLGVTWIRRRPGREPWALPAAPHLIGGWGPSSDALPGAVPAWHYLARLRDDPKSIALKPSVPLFISSVSGSRSRKSGRLLRKMM